MRQHLFSAWGGFPALGLTTGSLTALITYAIQTLSSLMMLSMVFAMMTIAENLRWGNEHATDEEVREAARLACADEFVEQFPEGYDTYIEEGGTNVSGGQKQRLCIARALLKKPKVLILDDSTSAVDTKTDAIIQHSFRTYIPDTTKIIISQRISSVQNADKIILMEDGHIAAEGTHEELLKTCPVYEEIFRQQQKGGAEDEQ